MYLWVHFERYLFANVEDIDTKRERFLQKREGKFGHMSAHKFTHQTHHLKRKERERILRALPA